MSIFIKQILKAPQTKQKRLQKPKFLCSATAKELWFVKGTNKRNHRKEGPNIFF